jgi:hypothetical protein
MAYSQSDNERFTTAAWMSYRTNQFLVAISNANLCIEQFEVQAEQVQNDMLRTNATMPPVGRVGTNLFTTIAAEGPLNDVATCYFIIGESKKQLVHRDGVTMGEARNAYERAKFFTYARCWDTNGYFWSVADAANARLKRLPPISK